MTYARRTRIVFVDDFCPASRIYSEVQKGSIGNVVSRKKNGWMRVRVDNTHEIVNVRNSSSITKLEKKPTWNACLKQETLQIAQEIMIMSQSLEYLADIINYNVKTNSPISSSVAKFVTEREECVVWRSHFTKLPILEVNAIKGPSGPSLEELLRCRAD